MFMVILAVICGRDAVVVIRPLSQPECFQVVSEENIQVVIMVE